MSTVKSPRSKRSGTKRKAKATRKRSKKSDQETDENTEQAREAFIDTLLQSAQRQIEDITQRINAGSRDSADVERDARATAALVKVLCALGSHEFDSGRAGAQTRQQNEATAEDNDGPRDLDEFRRELGRQMDEIIARRADRAAGGANDTGS